MFYVFYDYSPLFPLRILYNNEDPTQPSAGLLAQSGLSSLLCFQLKVAWAREYHDLLGWVLWGVGGKCAFYLASPAGT